MMTVPFFELRNFPASLEAAVTERLQQCLNNRTFILGPEGTAFEEAFSQYLGVAGTVGVGNGFDALTLSLKALGIGPGDDVLVPANSFIATINAVQHVGATPVLLEPDDITYNLTPEAIHQALTAKTRAVIPVHLFGQPCDMPGIMAVAQEANIYVVEDCAQAHGARVAGQKVGSFGHVNAFSFYPTKNLGAVGDAGAITSNHPDFLAFLRKYHNYGQSERYQYEMAGVNSRLDSLQAAVLSAKLEFLGQLNEERRRLAAVYQEQLAGVGELILPQNSQGVEHVYHLYVIRTRQRDQLQQFLQGKGIGTLIHYPVPAHLQKAYQHLGYRRGSLPVTEELAATSLSLPLFPGMTQVEQAYVVEHVKGFFS